ncbi:hypothetical protein E4U17_002301 [Claviceps sp. LM77 group G4]|nr:hypothetical protein E4U17_002301 [Claviceps sp. LM77 group G4]KAG6072469.1 hypothetical protein E4U33_003266 [Claviceps sp. LM78 group G4]KAG6079119.1 hypothetical protein E4U16_001245 [Claviceps sp. LM84 group G4]
MSCGSSVLPLNVPAITGDGLIQSAPKLREVREHLLLYLEAPMEVIEASAQEGLGYRVFSSCRPGCCSRSGSARIREYGLWHLAQYRENIELRRPYPEGAHVLKASPSLPVVPPPEI